jgi:hypothetical protein
MPDSSISPTSDFSASDASAFHAPTPLHILIDPPDVQSGMPGDGLQISVVVQNLGHQSAVIDVVLDADSILKQWCRSARQRLALDHQQSHQVVFEFDLPSHALPGTYDYTIVVDAPQHYPEDTPLQYAQQLRVLSKIQTRFRPNDPTFFLNPATHSQKPVRLKPGEILPIEVRVENRANRVDRFRLVSLDAEADWLTIRYPNPNRNLPGQIEESTSLELNPSAHGIIRLEIHPPIHTLAGLYSPTLRLYSDNQPDLVLLDLLYLDIEAIETLNVEMKPILDRVGRRAGEYQIKLANRGNVLRQLSCRASCREEEERCSYDYHPAQVDLPPGREAQVQLYVAPIRKWQRPLWGAGRAINFQIELQDTHAYQLPEPPLQARLIWQARPWWQVLLGAILVLGMVSGMGFLVWRLFFKPPLPIVFEAFQPTSLEYTEGDLVQLSWRIRNPDRIQSLSLTSQMQDTSPDANPLEPKTFEFDASTPPTDLPDTCPEDVEQLCQQYTVGRLAAGQYEFNLSIHPRSGKPPEPVTSLITVAAKPDPQINRFEPTQAEYESGTAAHFNWNIENIAQLATLTVIAIGQNNERANVAEYSFEQGIPESLQSVCQRQVETLTCSEIPISGLRFGVYTFELHGTTVRGATIQSQPTTTTVTIKPRSLRIVSFNINGQTEGGIINLNLNQPVEISWNVEGGEGEVKVKIDPILGGGLPPAGFRNVGSFSTPGDRQIQITATDEAGQTETSSFSIIVAAPPSPTPSLRPTPPRPTPPSPSTRLPQVR